MGCCEPSLELSDLGQRGLEWVSNIWKSARAAFDLSYRCRQILVPQLRNFIVFQIPPTKNSCGRAQMTTKAHADELRRVFALAIGTDSCALAEKKARNIRAI